MDIHVDAITQAAGASASPMRVPADAQLPVFSWQVEGTLLVRTNQNSVNKPGTFHEYRRPAWFQVAAPTLEDAIAKVRERYPEVVLIKALKDRHVEAVIA